MKEKIGMLFQKTQEGIASSKLLLDKGFYSVSVSQSYYAMFYMAEAVLLTKSLKFSSHRSVISLFGQHFVKTNIFPPHLSQDLSKAFDERLLGDYSFESKITQEAARNAITRAENFIKITKEYLIKEGYTL